MKIQEQSSIGNVYLFQGREYETETGLYYFRARYYDPVISRFLQPDPKGYVDSMNLYQALNQNPINFIDPFGTWYLSGELTRVLEKNTVRIYPGASSPLHIETILGFIPKYWVVKLIKAAFESFLEKSTEPFLKAGTETGVEMGIEKWSMWRTGNKILSKLKGAGVATMFRLFDTIRALKMRELPSAFIESKGRRRYIDVDQMVLYVMYITFEGNPLESPYPYVFANITVLRNMKSGGRIKNLIVQYYEPCKQHETKFEKETMRAELILRLLYIQLQIRRHMEEWGQTFKAVREWTEVERETYEIIRRHLTEKELEVIDFWIEVELMQLVRGLRPEYYWLGE